MKKYVYRFTFSLARDFNSSNGFVRNSFIKRLFSSERARVDSTVLNILRID